MPTRLPSAQQPVDPGQLRSGGHWTPTGSMRSTPASRAPPDPIALEPGHEIGRFTVLSYLGAGAMGIVYAAYDPELDRKVALKVLRPQSAGDTRGRTRLNDEAQAMAKVSHPNVAVVHEVGIFNNDIFIAMEFIRGETLQEWVKSQPRPWNEILDAFIQAGRGLAAAHAAGVVHRDFKPGNAIIGDDGRVRVLDFGLSSSASRSHPEVVGTPAYMPPEQFLGQPVGPAADQFSLCASLYQALFGQLPFAGDSPDALRLAITGGQLRSPPRHVRVPSWLTAAVLRGLKHDPKDRFSSMDDLLRTLEHRRTRARRPLLIAIAGVATVLGLGGGYLGAQRVTGDPCSGGAEQIAGVWHPQAGADIAAAFGALPPAFSATLWPQVERELAHYADEWETRYRGVCQAQRRRELPGEFVTRSHACFERARAALAAAVVVLREADASVALHALEVANSLPSPSECSDGTGLMTPTGAASDPATALAQRQILAKVEAVKVHARAGRTVEAKRLAELVIYEAHQLGDRSTLAEAYLQRGRLDLEDDPSQAEPYLTRAYLLALGAGDDVRVAEALALRLYARARIPGGLARAFEDFEVVQQQLTRIGAPPELRGLTANNAGVLYLAAGDAERSEALFQEALTLRKAAVGERDLEVGKTLGNLAILARDPVQVEERIGRSLAIFETELGSAHPDTIAVRILAGALARDPVDAATLVEPGCDALDAYRPGDLRERANCLLHLAGHARAAGDVELADASILRARALVDRTGDPGAYSDPEAALIRGHAALVDGGHLQAIAGLRQALKDLPGDEWWQQRKRAEVELCIGLNLLKSGDPEAARAALAHSVETFAEIADNAHDAVLPRDLALARRALEDALTAHNGR